MKFTCIFLIALLGVSMSLESEFQSDLTSLIQMQTSANGAISSVLGLLNDLRQANTNEQNKADAINKTTEALGRKEIKALRSIEANNLAVWRAAKTHLKWVQNELKDTVDSISFMQKRQKDIAAKLRFLQDQRCYANAMFVKALKEHAEAQDVIVLLEKDLQPFKNKKSLTSFAQISNVADKLSAYAHLFTDNAMKQFVSLAEVDAFGQAKPFDFANAGADDIGADDEKDLKTRPKKAVKKTFGKTLKRSTDKRTPAQIVLDMLDTLRKHLKQSIVDLQKNEIQAAYDFASFQHNIEIENVTLNSDLVRKAKYQQKLHLDVHIAKNYERKAHGDYNVSVKARVKAEKALEVKRQYYMSETARRTQESATLDQVIFIFRKKIASVTKFLNNRVEDFQKNKSFAKTTVTRRTAGQVAADSGKLAKNLARETA